MSTTREDIQRWLDEGKAMGATHVIVATDTFDYEDYPVFVRPGQNALEIADKINKESMQKVMECYSLARDTEAQLNENRAYHYE
jgi:hypothetical protein